MKPAFSSLTRNKFPLFVVVFFSILALFSHLFPYFGFDLVITRWVQSYDQSWILKYLTLISMIGNITFLPLFVLFSFGVLYLFKLKTEALLNLVSILSALFVNGILKTLVNRPRPVASLVDIYTVVYDKSFPSGHTMTYTVVFGFLFYLVMRRTKNKVLKTILGGILILPIMTVGLSRIYLGAHWTSDVLGGYLLGALWLYGIISYYKYLEIVQS